MLHRHPWRLAPSLGQFVRPQLLLAALLGAAFTALVAFAASSVYAAVGSPPEHELRAKRFVLVDDDGQVRGDFGLGADGGTRLAIRDSENKSVVSMGFDKAHVPSLSIADAEGRPQADLTIFGGSPRLVLLSPAGKVRIGLVADKDSPRIDLLGADGKVRCSLNLAQLQFFDK
jgi:hypothetical protein